jgi:hypothetical protein
MMNTVDDIEVMPVPVKYGKVRENGKPVIGIWVEKDTTIRDMEMIWPDIQRLQDELPHRVRNKRQPSNYFARDKRAYELRQAGRAYKEIAEILAAEKLAPEGLLTTDIGTIIRNLEKRISY